MSEKQYPTHEELVLENFTAFERAKFSFVPGVNAIIGENGTGKTHILKVLYAAHKSWLKIDAVPRSPFFQSIFQIEDSIIELIRHGGPAGTTAKVEGTYGGTWWGIHLTSATSASTHTIMLEQDIPVKVPKLSRGHTTYMGFPHGPIQTPVFIPAIDMMGHTKGFLSTYDNYDIDFDLTHREIVSLLLSPEKRELDEAATKLVADLTACIGGEVELSGERFYLVTEETSLPMTAVAEGFRKIATLIRLVQTGWLGPGSTLFWDEPEVNLNPKLMDEVVGAILALSRAGVQVFLATHSYIILKELEVQSRKSDSLRFFSLESTPSGTKVHQASRYLDLKPNKIEEQYGELYDRGIAKLAEGNVES